MEKIRLLLYCNKRKPLLYRGITAYTRSVKYVLDKEQYLFGKIETLNGKIVAECDFEVEEHKETTIDWLCMSLREKIIFGRMCRKANIDELECLKYANGKPLYAIHIKNLNIFDEPKELREYTTRKPKTYETMTCDSCMENIDCKQCSYNYEYQEVMKAPQNMMKVCEWNLKDYVLISIRPEWLCKILNGEQTILVRKKVLKEMVK